MKKNKRDGRRAQDGMTVIELTTVAAIIIILGAVTVPQLLSARRSLRSAGMAREIMTQLRYARQLAMSQRKAITFQYDNRNNRKEIIIIQHNLIYDPDGVANSGDETRVGTRVLSDPNYPFTTGNVTLRTIPLASAGVPQADIIYGRPSGASTSALGDGTNLTALTSNRVSITFQPDGSVINAAGAIVDRAFFFYNNRSPQSTASAISVLGAAGRVRLWRYNSGTSPGTYIE